MSIAKRKTTVAIVDWVIPYLKQKGFTGTFPNFRRITPKQIDLVTFQFTCCNQALGVNVAKCPHEGIRYKYGEFVKPTEAIALHCPKRLYLGVQEGHDYHWFKFSARKLEIMHKDEYPFLTVYKDSLLKYKYIANDIIRLFENQAEPWLENSEAWWGKELPVYNKFFMDLYNGIQKASNNSCKKQPYVFKCTANSPTTVSVD